jgi:hypothetical protein
VLIHPTNYLDADFSEIPDTAITQKMAYKEALTSLVRPFSYFTTIRNFGTYWRARDKLSVDFEVESGGKRTIHLTAVSPFLILVAPFSR